LKEWIQTQKSKTKDHHHRSAFLLDYSLPLAAVRRPCNYQMHHPDWNTDHQLLEQRRLDLTLHHRLLHLALHVESLALEGAPVQHDRRLACPLFAQKVWNEIRWDQAQERLRGWVEAVLEQGE
jgi:hypothetical protein